MESFLLSETLKYLYLTFDDTSFVHGGDYVFSTEAHLFPVRPEWKTAAADPQHDCL